MPMILFVAEVSGNDAAGYHAEFPDFENCSAEAATLPDLIGELRRSIAFQMDSLEKVGEAWPQATPLSKMVAKPGSFLIPVDVAVDDPPIRVNVSLGERLVQRLDAAAEARGMTRSGFIAHSVRASLGDTMLGKGEIDKLSQRLQDEFKDLGKRINETIGPGSEFSKRMNQLDDAILLGVQKTADRISASAERHRKTERSNSPHVDADLPQSSSD